MKKVLPLLVTLVMMTIIAMIVVSMAQQEQPITIVKGNMAMQPLPINLSSTKYSALNP